MALRSPLCLLAALLVATSVLPGDARAATSPAFGFSAPVRLSDPGPELTPDAGNANLNELTAAGGLAFFTAYLPATGTELWVTDGTPLQGTRLVRDIVPGRESSHPHQLTALGDNLLFVTNQKLWVSDGTPGGTRQLGDLQPAYDRGIRVVGDRAFIITQNWPTHEGQLWVSDGTEGGTRLVASVWVDVSVALGDKLAFVSYVGSEANLWLSDGTEAGTKPVRAFNGIMGAIVALRDAIYFFADDSEHGFELWRSDGSAAGTRLVRDISPKSSIDYFYFTACSYAPPELVVWQDRLYFAADDGTHGSELWSSDGTEAGTLLVADISGDRSGSHPLRLIGLPGALLFVAHTAALGYELWRSDGTQQGTGLVRDINLDARSSQLWLRSTQSVLCPVFGKFTAAARVGDSLLLTSADDEHGFELWTSDGTTAGTQLVSDLVPGAGSSTPDSFARLGGQILFRATDARGSVSLWAVRAQPYQQLVPIVRR